MFFPSRKPASPAALAAWALVLLAVSAGVARAQITESPLTVEPGRFLVEMDALSVTIDRNGGDKYTGVGAATTFLTMGVTRSLDIQIGADMYVHQKFTSGGLEERRSGIGDLYGRFKWCFWRDDQAGSAAAFLPYVKLPTNSGGVGNKAVEGGLIMPWMMRLPGNTTLDLMASVDFARNDNDDGYDVASWFSGSFSRPLFGPFAAYGEAVLSRSTGSSLWDGRLGGGLTLTVSERAWWDFSVYRGLSNGAADWNPVIRFNFGF